jgi:hypothetical protein
MLTIDFSTALIAVQALDERLGALRVRAAADARWKPELERAEGARAALDAAIDIAHPIELGGRP